MIRKNLLGLLITFSLQQTFAEDFRKIYSIAAGGEIVIGSYMGDVRVRGYEGDSIEVLAYKKGADRDYIEIDDRSLGNRIELHTRFLKQGHGSGSADFEIRVPNSVEYNFSRLSSMAGKVEVSGVIGRIRAESVRGDVEVKDVTGLVSASSVSGNVRVEIDRVSGRSNMRFSSISGNIDVRAPANLNALIEMSSASGLLKTDFPIEIHELRYGPGRSARGRLGSGSQVLRISSVSGQVSLIQK